MENRGAALVWAVISIVVVGILVVAALTVGNSYASRSIHENQQRQAYLTARSGAAAVVSLLDGYSVSGEAGDSIKYNSPLIPEVVSNSVSLTNFDFPVEMGECKGFITRSADDQLEVTVMATVGERSEKVKALILREITIIPGTAEGGSIKDLFKGLYVNDLSLASKTSVVTEDGTDVYINDLGFGGIAGKMGSSLKVGGNLYIAKENKLKDVDVTIGEEQMEFQGMDLPGKLYLEKPLTWLNDNPPNDIDLYSTSNRLFPRSFVLCRLDEVEANGRKDLDGIILPTIDIYVSNDQQPYAIKVAGGASLNLNLKNNSTSGEVPEVYIFLDEKHGWHVASLRICHVDEDIKLFVCGGNKSIVTIADDVTITGGISVDNLIVETGNTLTLNYAAPGNLQVYTSDPAEESGGEPEEPQGGDSEGEPGEDPEEGGGEIPVVEVPDIEVHTWSFEKYEEG